LQRVAQHIIVVVEGSTVIAVAGVAEGCTVYYSGCSAWVAQYIIVVAEGCRGFHSIL